ncbi:MAG TPA: hypothetical protein VI893_04110 [Thermoplasmata archaeon]|nr:hypothetical protein [Thermoplasmata archaeon]
MKIGKALAEKKAAQNALARLMGERTRNFYYEKGKKPEVVLADLEKKIRKQVDKIRDLKLRVIYTNSVTRLENGMSLQEAIIRLGDVRSELDSYNGLLGLQKYNQTVYVEGRAVSKEQLPQIERNELLDRIEKMEAEKYQLDALIAKANSTVDIGEKLPAGRR